MGTGRKRLDDLVVERSLAPSRNAARGLIMAGLVMVEGKVVDKAGAPVLVDAQISLKARPRFVSRAGEKLDKALSLFGVEVGGRDCLDVGASTGGFVDCLLQRGAARVVALDVGRGQLDARLRGDVRVTVLEGVNARLLQKGDLPYYPDVVTMDVSFISLAKVLGPVMDCMASPCEGVLLVKPQFEAGPQSVGKNGIVRDPEVHATVLTQATAFMSQSLGLAVAGVCRSAVPGVGGNVEFFVHVKRTGETGLDPGSLREAIRLSVFEHIVPQGAS